MYTYELQSNIRYKLVYAYSGDSNQSGYPCSPISLSFPSEKTLDPWLPIEHPSKTNQLARSQVAARKHVLQHHMGCDARNPDFVACEQQRRNQPAHLGSLISAFDILYLKSKVTRSDFSQFFHFFHYFFFFFFFFFFFWGGGGLVLGFNIIKSHC